MDPYQHNNLADLQHNLEVDFIAAPWAAAPQGYAAFHLVFAAIKFFYRNNTPIFAGLVAVFMRWADSWDGLPSTTEMERAMDMLSNIFFLGTLMVVPVVWDATCVRDKQAYGRTVFSPFDTFPLWIELDPGDHSRQKGVRDHRSAIISILLHEMCHVFLGWYACDGKCGSVLCRAQDPRHNKGHGPAWFMLAIYIQLMARRLFPDLDIRLTIFRSVAGDCKTLLDLPHRAFWHGLTQRFDDDEIDDLLAEMAPDEERTLDNAYRGDPFFGRRGLKVGIRRMQWARDGRLPGMSMVNGEVVFDVKAISNGVPSDAWMGNAAQELLLRSPSYPPVIPPEARRCAINMTYVRQDFHLVYVSAAALG